MGSVRYVERMRGLCQGVGCCVYDRKTLNSAAFEGSLFSGECWYDGRMRGLCQGVECYIYGWKERTAKQASKYFPVPECESVYVRILYCLRLERKDGQTGVEIFPSAGVRVSLCDNICLRLERKDGQTGVEIFPSAGV